MGCIYSIVNTVNGKAYIGQTINFQRRKREHYNLSARGVDAVIYRAIRKYGIENFTWSIIEDNVDRASLSELEIYYIAFFNTYEKGYNSTIGGEGTVRHKYVTSEETKKKLSKAGIGRKHSKESIIKMGISQRNPELQTRKRAARIAKKGKGNYIKQYTIEGIFVKEYDCITEASLQTGISFAMISANLKGIYQIAGGFLWAYTKNKCPTYVKPYNSKKEVMQYSLEGTFIKEWGCTTDIVNELGISRKRVQNVCTGVQLTGAGFIWAYKGNKPTPYIDPKIAKMKKIIQYSIDGGFIKKWNNAKEVSQSMGITIGGVWGACSANFKSLLGFLWAYENEPIPVYEKGTNNKSVSQYSMDGAFIITYPSIKEASIAVNRCASSITGALIGRQKTSGGFMWSYEGYHAPTYIKPNHGSKCVSQFSEDGVYMFSYDSLAGASKSTGIPLSSICCMLKDRVKTAGGFIWKYKDNE